MMRGVEEETLVFNLKLSQSIKDFVGKGQNTCNCKVPAIAWAWRYLKDEREGVTSNSARAHDLVVLAPYEQPRTHDSSVQESQSGLSSLEKST